MKNFEMILGSVASRLSGNIYLMALRDAFMLAFPLTMFASIILVVINFPLFSSETIEILNMTFSHAIDATMSLMAMFVTLGVGYYVSLYKYPEMRDNAIFSAVISLSSFLMVTNFSTVTEAGEVVSGIIPVASLGTSGMFVALIVGFVASSLFCLFTDKKLTIKLPEQVPPAISKSFEAIIPGFITLGVFFGIYTIFAKTSYETLNNFVFMVLQQPLMSLGTSFTATMIAMFLIGFLWFFGIHGHNIVNPIMSPIWQTASLENLSNFNNGVEPTHIVTQQFVDIFTVGIGSTGLIAALIAIFISSKLKQEREIAKMALTPAVFNIGEPILFGVPIILNPMYFVPWVLTPMILAGTTYGAMAIGIVPLTTGVAVPWTTPIVISGMLATNSIVGGLWQLVELAILVCLWIPFVIVASKAQGEKNDI